jgi:hypothetical protein
MYFVFTYENEITEPVEIVLRSVERGCGRTMEEGECS